MEILLCHSVKSKYNIMSSRVCLLFLFNPGFPPSFTKFPLQPNTYGTLMGNATLICNPESAPPSTKTWLKNGIGLNPSSDPQQRVQQLPNGNLHITQLQSDDAGNYTCEAENLLGKASSTGQLTVLRNIFIYSTLQMSC